MNVAEKIDVLKTSPFLDGPAEFLCKSIAEELLALKVFAMVFGEFIDPYPREDYPMRAFPALRIYNERARSTGTSSWLEGEIKMDCIWPPSLRRAETQALPDMMAGALHQQLRSPLFFKTIGGVPELGQNGKVPGLSELGRTIDFDKTKGFAISGSQEVAPATCLVVNFKIDLRRWDDHLKDTYRTREIPFEKTLVDLERWIGSIMPVRDDGTEEPGITLQIINQVEE